MPTEGTERSGCQGLIRAPFCLTAVIGGEVGMLIPHDATCTGLKTKFFIFSRGSNGQVLIILSYCHFDDGTNAPSTLFKVNSTTRTKRCPGLIRAPFCHSAVIGGRVGMLIPHDATCAQLKA